MTIREAQNVSKKLLRFGAQLLLVALLSLPYVYAQEKEDLARKVQNPVSDLISVPFQNNTNFGVGPTHDHRTQDILNIQPVIPVTISDDWNLITRTIAPVIWQPTFGTQSDPTFGLGDINPTFFVSPSKPSKFIWGLGPTFTAPTATDKVLGTGKMSMGPAAVGLVMDGPWVVGALVNNQWSIGGSDNRPDVNSMLLQYFINYNLPEEWYISSSPIITANWEAEDSNTWTVPVGGGVGKIVRVGPLPLNVQLTAYYNVVTPDYASGWSLRSQVAFLFPK